MECFLCQDNPGLLIRRYKHWEIRLHPNQSYLGRCFVVLNHHIIDFFDMRQEEKDEFFNVMTRLRNVIQDLFKPDLFNYSFFGNTYNHLHANFIPRYKEKRMFKNMGFFDKRWGYNYSPYDKDFSISSSVLNELKESIRRKLA